MLRMIQNGLALRVRYPAPCLAAQGVSAGKQTEAAAIPLPCSQMGATQAVSSLKPDKSLIRQFFTLMQQGYPQSLRGHLRASDCATGFTPHESLLPA